jgi:rare lipoprotein A
MLLAAGAARAQIHRDAHGAGWEQSGQASWYGGWHNGRRTSSGSIFDDRKMTAAHATLPLGSKVRVTVQETGRSVVVVINDRQPDHYARIIDLSRGAASRIGLIDRGVAMVTLDAKHVDEPEEVAEAP